VCRQPCLFDLVEDPAVEMETEEPDKDVTEDRRGVLEREFAHLDRWLTVDRPSQPSGSVSSALPSPDRHPCRGRTLDRRLRAFRHE